MGQIIYADFSDTVPMTVAQIRAHTKRPYIARGLESQGRYETPLRVSLPPVSVPGLLFLAFASMCAVAMCAAFVLWVAA